MLSTENISICVKFEIPLENHLARFTIFIFIFSFMSAYGPKKDIPEPSGTGNKGKLQFNLFCATLQKYTRMTYYYRMSLFAIKRFFFSKLL